MRKKTKKTKQEIDSITNLNSNLASETTFNSSTNQVSENLFSKENNIEEHNSDSNKEVEEKIYRETDKGNDKKIEQPLSLFPLVLGSKSLMWVAIAVASLFKLYLAAYTMGTNDIFYWKMFLSIAREYGGIALYQKLSWWNHPPMMIHLLNLIGFIESTVGISFNFLLRLLPTLADIGSLWVVYKILELNNKFSLAQLLLLAFCPISIMISGFHGNTDPIMIFFVILSVYLIDLDSRSLDKLLPEPIYKFFLTYEINNYHLAGIAMGLAVNVKIVPVILAPCIFFYLPNNKRRFEYALSALSTVVFTSLPYIFQDPLQVFKSTFGYSSFYGNWGLSRVLLTYFPYEHWVNKFFSTDGKFLVFGLIILVSLWMNLFSKKTKIFYQVGVIFYLFIVLSPGFSVQYLAWLTPWVTILGLEAMAICYLTGSLFLFLTYNWWSGGLPWNLASADTGNWGGIIINYELLCWGAFLVILFAYFLHIFFEKYSELEPSFLIKQKSHIWAITSILIILISVKAFSDIVLNYGPHLYSVQGKTLLERQKKILERTYVGMSAIYSENGFYQESINSCSKALEVNPANADAYNNICVAYINLKEWDKAIEAGNKALEINPNFQLVKNNIAWAVSQKNADSK
ncbi:MAG: tetratricopeptide repeat protein [Acidobacteria bacterium]|nr:tetratricopeptide repeat protein [Acidobacteriota bacterium]